MANHYYTELYIYVFIEYRLTVIQFFEASSGLASFITFDEQLHEMQCGYFPHVDYAYRKHSLFLRFY